MSSLILKKQIVFGNALKPNPRFERHSKSEDVTTFDQSAIKAKVKELEKAMSIDEEDITMGDSQLIENKIGSQNQKNEGRRNHSYIIWFFA